MNGIVASKFAVLAKHAFFRDVSPYVVNRLACRLRITREPAGHVLFRKGDPGENLIALTSGIVKISLPGKDDKEIILNFMREGEIFGELTIMDGGPRTGDAVTVTRCEMIRVDRRDVLAAVRDDPDFSLRLFALASARLRETSKQVEDISFASAEARLAKALLKVADVQHSDEFPHDVRVTQKALGWVAGLSRESTNKILGEWESAGYVRRGQGRCLIRDWWMLQKLAADDDV